MCRVLVGLAVATTLAIGCGGDDATDAPMALLKAPAAVDLGSSATLDASGSTDENGDITTYRFTVADGTAPHVSGRSKIDHVFSLEGAVEVLLEVIDAQGNVGRARAVIAVRRR